MPTPEQNERIATLEANYKNTDEKIGELSDAVRDLSKEVRTLSDSMQQTKGGWRVIIAIATVGGLFGEIIRWCMGHLSFKVGG